MKVVKKKKAHPYRRDKAFNPYRVTSICIYIDRKYFQQEAIEDARKYVRRRTNGMF